MIRVDQIIGLPVFTESGQHLGRVKDVEIDERDMRIERFVVHENGLSHVFEKPLLIARTQVVAFLPDKLIVEDAVIKDFEPSVAAG